jgi:5-methylcytosine-specific restriction endonuclease McrA
VYTGIVVFDMAEKTQEQKKKKAATDAKYLASHREQCCARKNAWRRKNPDHVSKYNRDYLVARLAGEGGDEFAERRRNSRKSYRHRNPSLIRERKARKRAIEAGAPIGDLEKIAEIYKRAKTDKNVRCFYCHEVIPMGKRHVDHVRPLSKHGPHAAYNLVITCASCNMKKRDKEPGDLGMLL